MFGINATLKIVIIDHHNGSIYTNMRKSALDIQLQLRCMEAASYQRKTLKENIVTEIPETNALVDRFNNTFWIDIIGDYIP